MVSYKALFPTIRDCISYGNAQAQGERGKYFFNKHYCDRWHVFKFSLPFYRVRGKYTNLAIKYVTLYMYPKTLLYKI